MSDSAVTDAQYRWAEAFTGIPLGGQDQPADDAGGTDGQTAPDAGLSAPTIDDDIKADASKADAGKADAAGDAKAKAKRVTEAADKVTKMSDDDLKKLPTADKVKMVKDLFAKGTPTGDARKAQIKIYKDMDLDPGFKKLEGERGDRITKALKDDKDLQDARANWDKKTDDDKKKALTKIIAAQSKEYGFPAPEIVLMKPPQPPDKDGAILNGEYSAPPKGDGKLHLNPYKDPKDSTRSSSFQDFEKAVTTALHENGHNYQARLVKDLRAGKIKPGDPEYAQATMFDVNDDDNAYIQPDEDYDAYKKQPEEDHSRTMGPETAGKLNRALHKAK